MRFFKQNNKVERGLVTSPMGGSAFTMETLEHREFLSASPAPAHKTPAPPPPPAHHAAAAAPAKKVTPPAPAKKVTPPAKAPAPAKKTTPAKTTPVTPPVPKPVFTTNVIYPDLLGSWTGTYLALPFGAPVSFSVTLTSQKNGSAVGTIKLGGMGGVTATMETTFQISTSGNIQVYIPTATGQVSLTAGLSANGSQMVGRWCSHVGIAWTVGTFIMTKA